MIGFSSHMHIQQNNMGTLHFHDLFDYKTGDSWLFLPLGISKFKDILESFIYAYREVPFIFTSKKEKCGVF